MPQSKAGATTDLAAANLNPFGNAAVKGGQTVVINVTYEGVSPDLDGLLTAIETFYGADTVSNEADTAARGVLRLRVIA